MSRLRQGTPPDLPEGFPPEAFDPLVRLFRSRESINVRIKPREAWIIVALIQFASRNPNIGDSHRDLLRWFGDELADGITRLEPSLTPYLALGWDAANDVPIEREKGE